MASREFMTHSPEETIERGREIAAGLKAPVIVLLSGDLGAGKTTLAKGIVSGLGAAEEEEVTSPTFTLVHRYGRAGCVYHIDLYRVTDTRDLETLGLEDIFSEKAIVLVEWPEKLALSSDWPIVRVHLEHIAEDTRRVRIENPA